MSSPTSFGAFFRSTRGALGLSISEFSRRNGFDKGNVSRLERGVVPAPQSRKVLEAYAKALGLARRSGPWDRFFELAAACSGRIPDELLKSSAAARAVPELLRKLREGPGHRNWVTARDLEHWAGSLPARSVLPQLVRRLVHATGRSLSQVSFPAGEQVQRPGFDGVTKAGETDPFVPSGMSVWEMGVDAEPASKAGRDYKKRVNQSLGVNKRCVTYIVVTPRKWQAKGEWCLEKRKQTRWADVRVYDSADLEEWLELAPAVDAWLARLIGLKTEGLTDLEDYWQGLQGLTRPPLTAEVFLASRGEQSAAFKAWLAGPAGAAAIESGSPSEGIDFAAAVIRESSSHDALAARVLVVESKDAWRSAVRSGGGLILIAHPSLLVEAEMVAEAVQRGHHAVFATVAATPGLALRIRLPRAAPLALQKGLISCGLDSTRALGYAQMAGGSVTVLKRLLPSYSGTAGPRWGSPTEAASLAPLLLAGAWEDTSPGDRKALERLAARPFGDLGADRWLGEPDAPVTRVLSLWRLVSRDDSWQVLARALTRDALTRFEEVALEVLGEDDPSFELPPDERWMAAIKGKSLGHSRALRSGLAETLALLAARPGAIGYAPDAASRVGEIVYRLLHGTGWRRWASLSGQLPLLAEAAPDVFLKALRSDLEGTEPAMRALFQQGGRGALFTSTPHCGVLWALERMAWDPSMVSEVCHALARLHESASREDRGNSPMRSLASILTPWFPQTTANAGTRVRVVAQIVKKYPVAGWELLLQLLPQRSTTAMPTSRPDYRDWALDWSEGASTAEFDEQVDACGGLLVQLGGTDAGRLQLLVGRLEDLPPRAGAELVTLLHALDLTALDGASRRAVADALREKVGRHRRHAATDWALPEAVLDRLDEALHRFEPDGVVARNSWLFAEDWDVLDRQGTVTLIELPELRREALRRIVGEAGWEGVLNLVELAKSPSVAGYVLGETGGVKDDKKVLPAMLGADSERLSRFARGYAWGRFRAMGWAWAGRLKAKSWAGRVAAEFAGMLPFEPRTWDWVARHGKSAERHYWGACRRHLPDPEPAALRRAVVTLVEHRRPFEACFVLWMAAQDHRLIDLGLVAEVLEAGVDAPLAESEPTPSDRTSHCVVEMIRRLQRSVEGADPAVDADRVASIEWGYLGCLDGRPATPVTLHGQLASRPDLFVAVLKLAFFSSEESRDEAVPAGAEELARATNAIRLLSSWRVVPGTRSDKSVDRDALFAWVREARASAEAAGRVGVCDVRIGEVLSHAPGEPSDGAWPCVPVRDAIEEFGSEAVGEGFLVGVINQRGAYCKGQDEGGDQERSFAERYAGYALACAVEWPATAAALRSIAANYERDAGRADAERELR